MRVLHFHDLADYALYLENPPEEGATLESSFQTRMSRFYGNRDLFGTLRTEVLPGLAQVVRARQGSALRCWRAGCASEDAA